MKIILSVINMKDGTESHEDTTWYDYQAMIAWVNREFNGRWSSLVISVLS